MGSIPLVNGGVALVDDADIPFLSRYRWWRGAQGYVFTALWVNGKSKNGRMHRLILDAPDGTIVDHINGDTLDNRRSNLRFVTQAQNMQNRRGATRASSSGVRNVYFHPRKWRKRPYQVRLQVDGRSMSFGYYATLDEASEAAKEARRQHMTHSAECEQEKAA